METAKAELNNFRQAPRKMRLVANLIRGKKVADVLVNLDFIAKKAAKPIKTLLESAVSNAKSRDISTEGFVVKTITVNSGRILYRRRPASRGSAHPIHKRTSAIFVEIGLPQANKVKTAKAEKVKKEKPNTIPEKVEKVKEVKKPAKKVTEKKQIKKTTKK